MGKKSGKNYKRAAAKVDSTINYGKNEAMQLVKDALDPKNILNPGKVVSKTSGD